MKIALAQIECAVGDWEANCEKYRHYAARAAQENCAVVIFPEMSDIGYVPAVISECAASWPGPAFNVASGAARANSISLICGMSERVGDAIFNSVAYFNGRGELRARYRKSHLFLAAPVHEDRVFSAGNEIVAAAVGGSVWGFSICFDLRFPELYRRLALQGAVVLLNCTAWPANRPVHWDALTRARAIENQTFFIGVNRVGSDGGLEMLGRSRVVTPRGEILAEGGSNSEELLVADLDLSLVAEFRAAIPTYVCRRPDLYGNLVADNK